MSAIPRDAAFNAEYRASVDTYFPRLANVAGSCNIKVDLGRGVFEGFVLTFSASAAMGLVSWMVVIANECMIGMNFHFP